MYVWHVCAHVFVVCACICMCWYVDRYHVPVCAADTGDVEKCLSRIHPNNVMPHIVCLTGQDRCICVGELSVNSGNNVHLLQT